MYVQVFSVGIRLSVGMSTFVEEVRAGIQQEEVSVCRYYVTDE
jgi:hypothetical protein